MNKYCVCVRCWTYNHEHYILDTLNGFIIQKTNFPVVFVIVDDFSTDNNVTIIKQFVQENFDLNSIKSYVKDANYGQILYAQHRSNPLFYIACVFLSENHYSKKKSKFPYILEWQNNSKYLITCEGDDYWIDPDKLQIQVDFLENNTDINMCAHAHRVITANKKELYDIHNSNHNGLLDSGLVIEDKQCPQTATYIYRTSIFKDIPSFFKTLAVGDYPLRVYFAVTGGIYYIDSVMSCYRKFSSGSWTSRMKRNKKAFIQHVVKMINFAISLDEYTEGKYHDNIKNRIDYCNYLKYLYKGNLIRAFQTNYYKNLPFQKKVTDPLRRKFPTFWYSIQKIVFKFKS